MTPRLLKTIVYKSAAFFLTGAIVYLFTHKFIESVALTVCAEGTTFLFYYLYEGIWERFNHNAK